MPGNTDHQLERFVFEEDAGVSYNSTSGAMVLASYAKHSPDIPSELTIHP
jgi:vacuolar protein sorting-associated protein IST1